MTRTVNVAGVLALALGCGSRTALSASTTSSCPTGFTDCDGQAATVCETETAADAQNCGACGASCPAGLRCARGVCRQPTEFVEVVAGSSGGGSTTCARRADDVVYCWGANESNQLGDGTIRPSSAPKLVDVRARGLVMARFISDYTCARTPDDTIACWGFGGLGMHALVKPTPHAINGPPHLARLAADLRALCALTREGRTFCVGTICSMGTNRCWAATVIPPGRTATDNKLEDVLEPSALALPPAVDLDIGVTVGADHRAWCWGVCAPQDDDQARLLREDVGTVTVGFYCGFATVDRAGRVQCTSVGSPVPGPRPDPERTRDVVQIANGSYHVCLRLRSGDVECWGNNVGPYHGTHGERVGLLGTGSPAPDVPSPARVVGIHDAVDIAAGESHTCAVRANGEVWCWGSNRWGQLGDGTNTPRTAPVQVKF